MAASNLFRVRAMLNLLAARLALLIDEKWTAMGRAPEDLHATVDNLEPGQVLRDGDPVPVNDWTIPLRVTILRLQDVFVNVTDDEQRGLQYVLDAFATWERAASNEMSDEDFDRQFRLLIAAAEALGLDREIIAHLQARLPTWAVPLAGGIGGTAGAAAMPFAAVGAVQALGFGAGGIGAGTTAAWMMSQGIPGVPMLQSIGAAGLGVGGTMVAVFSGVALFGGGVAGVAYYVHVHWENLARERAARPTFNSRVMFNNTRVCIFSVARQRYVTVIGVAGLVVCTEAEMPSGPNGVFAFGYSPDNKVWLRSALNQRYLRNSMFQNPRLRFDGESAQDYEPFEMFYVSRDRFKLRSGRVGGRFVAFGDDDLVHCEGLQEDVKTEFEFVML
jgi:hypothetical protein